MKAGVGGAPTLMQAMGHLRRTQQIFSNLQSSPTCARTLRGSCAWRSPEATA